MSALEIVMVKLLQQQARDVVEMYKSQSKYQSATAIYLIHSNLFAYMMFARDDSNEMNCP